MKHGEAVGAAHATLDKLDEEGLFDAYDPETCITAGELRAIGWAIPETIPDCGWVRRCSWEATCDGVSMGDEDGSMVADISLGFREPFRWLEVTLTVPKEVENG